MIIFANNCCAIRIIPNCFQIECNKKPKKWWKPTFYVASESIQIDSRSIKTNRLNSLRCLKISWMPSFHRNVFARRLSFRIFDRVNRTKILLQSKWHRICECIWHIAILIHFKFNMIASCKETGIYAMHYGHSEANDVCMFGIECMWTIFQEKNPSKWTRIEKNLKYFSKCEFLRRRNFCHANIIIFKKSDD